jgi:hypothetical protein
MLRYLSHVFDSHVFDSHVFDSHVFKLCAHIFISPHFFFHTTPHYRWHSQSFTIHSFTNSQCQFASLHDSQIFLANLLFNSIQYWLTMTNFQFNKMTNFQFKFNVAPNLILSDTPLKHFCKLLTKWTTVLHSLLPCTLLTRSALQFDLQINVPPN